MQVLLLPTYMYWMSPLVLTTFGMQYLCYYVVIMLFQLDPLSKMSSSCLYWLSSKGSHHICSHVNLVPWQKTTRGYLANPLYTIIKLAAIFSRQSYNNVMYVQQQYKKMNQKFIQYIMEKNINLYLGMYLLFSSKQLIVRL